MFIASHNTPDWYEGSVAATLSLLAHNSKNRVPVDLYATVCMRFTYILLVVDSYAFQIEEAAGRVFIRESYMNDIYYPLPSGRVPVGYKKGLGNLLIVASDKSLYDTPERAAASQRLVSLGFIVSYMVRMRR